MDRHKLKHKCKCLWASQVSGDSTQLHLQLQHAHTIHAGIHARHLKRLRVTRKLM